MIISSKHQRQLGVKRCWGQNRAAQRSSVRTIQDWSFADFKLQLCRPLLPLKFIHALWMVITVHGRVVLNRGGAFTFSFSHFFIFYFFYFFLIVDLMCSTNCLIFFSFLVLLRGNYLFITSNIYIATLNTFLN
jgi:hypothetical protein